MAKAEKDAKATATPETVSVRRESGIEGGTAPTANDQEMRELVFRLLWQAARIVPGATHKEINANMGKIRDWVGAERAEELERGWRGWKK